VALRQIRDRCLELAPVPGPGWDAAGGA